MTVPYYRRKRLLVVTYDVTGLTDEEIAGVELEAVVQGEPSERHPNVEVTTQIREET